MNRVAAGFTNRSPRVDLIIVAKIEKIMILLDIEIVVITSHINISVIIQEILEVCESSHHLKERKGMSTLL